MPVLDSHGVPLACPRCQKPVQFEAWKPYCTGCWFFIYDGPIDRSEAEQLALEQEWPWHPLGIDVKF